HVSEVREDLFAEQGALDRIVADLGEEQWDLATPSPRWSVADQIGHLAYFDEAAAIAIADPETFADLAFDLMASLSPQAEATALDDATLEGYRALSASELLAAWRSGRDSLAHAASHLDDDTRVMWFGPSMGSKSFLTARLMETWAHGQDIVDTLGAVRPATDRLRHIAQLGYITRGWSYLNRGLEVPDTSVRVELVAPSGDAWIFGPDDAVDSVVGESEAFCLVVTQRRHGDDTELVLNGSATRDWLEKAQVFAGGASDGPAAGALR
ncbi:MAG: TIGR03084 family metal-binding protein, partial [Acidimicrobiales bacterium]